MLRELASFCWADREFFETPDRIRDTASRYADPTELDGSWHRTGSGAWVTLRPAGLALPEQGWKIHVSTTLADSAKVLDIVWRYCVDRSVPFKFLRSELLLLLLNEKSFPRASSGKFVTIYPADERALETILTELYDLLSPYTGPYILGDLRFRGGPLYVRYGGFQLVLCDTGTGERTPAVRRPDGTLVPDVRSASFTVPEWVELPAFLAPELAARNRPIDEPFPFAITGAIQFSNSGGVYLATDEGTGEPVVVREARPHAGLDESGTDAVTRLARERWALEKLAGLDCVPQLIGYRVVREHHYLVEEFVEGETLLVAVITRCPLADPNVSDADRTGYAAWAGEVLANVAAALAAVHARGLSFGDLHPSNIIVRPDNSVVFVDFEFAAETAEHRRPVMAAQGFVPPAPLAGVDADLYALECVRLMTLLPATSLLERDRAKLPTLIRAASAELPVPPPAADRMRRVLGRAYVPPDRADALFADLPSGWAALRDALVGTINASATPERTDRLFPGDPAQFGTGGIDLASGAAGVLYALHRTGGSVRPTHVDWLADRALALPDPRPGLYTGLHGVAGVLDLLGRPEAARAVLGRVRGYDRLVAADLRSGLAGVALGLLRLARRTGDPDLLTQAVELGGRLDEALGRHGTIRLPDGPGLMGGLTGLAALFLALYDDTGDPAWLDGAETCLRRDLTRCKARSAGTLYVLDGSRHLPYLDSGSLGIAVVLSRYLRHRPDPELAAAAAAARRAADAPFVIQSGLALGRAGLVLGLAEIGHPDDTATIRGQVRRLGWHAVNHRGGVAFPGAHLLRLSMDLLTGSAGVLLAVHAAVGRDGTFLPFLDRPDESSRRR